MESNVPVKQVRSREDGNNLYPLPHDYYGLTTDGRRKARVNACRQWLAHPSQTQAQAAAFVECVEFFDNYYLRPDLDDDGYTIYDPYFYDHIIYPRPVIHNYMIRQSIANAHSIQVAPRGAAKTTGVCLIPTLVELLTRPATSVIYSTSSGRNAIRFGERAKLQLYGNRKIVDDWSPEYDGRIQPRKSEGSQAMDNFMLSNYSRLEAFGVGGRQRGVRPLKYILDDPEWDAEETTSMEDRREFMDRLIERVIKPMILERGRYLQWIGTFVSQRHFLWRAAKSDIAEFRNFHRCIIPASREIDGKLVSCWPEKWPVNDVMRSDLGLPHDTTTLEEIRISIGEPAFQAEYMANPGAGGMAYFPELTEEKNGWGFVPGTLDHNATTAPHYSKAMLVWKEGQVTVRRTFSEFLAAHPTFITVDTSYTANANSDYKVAQVLALVGTQLFSLDAFAGRVEPHVFCAEIMRLVDTYRPVSVHVEAIHAGLALMQDLSKIMEVRAVDDSGEHFAPVMGLHPGNSRKEARIATLWRRFNEGSIKLPWAMRDHFPYSMLFEQIVGFVPAIHGGGLQNDDLIDTLWMGSFVQTGIARADATPEIHKVTPLERMASGDDECLTMVEALLTAPADQYMATIRKMECLPVGSRA